MYFLCLIVIRWMPIFFGVLMFLLPYKGFGQQVYKWSFIPEYGILSSKGNIAAAYRDRSYHFYKKNVWNTNLEAGIGGSLQLELLEVWKVAFQARILNSSHKIFIRSNAMNSNVDLSSGYVSFLFGMTTSFKMAHWQLNEDILKGVAFTPWLGLGLHFNQWPYSNSNISVVDPYTIADVRIGEEVKDIKSGTGCISLNLSIQVHYKSYWSLILGMQYVRQLSPIHQIKYHFKGIDGLQDFIVVNTGTHNLIVYAAIPLRFWTMTLRNH